MLSSPLGVRRTHRRDSPQALWVWVSSGEGANAKTHTSSGVKLCRFTKGLVAHVRGGQRKNPLSGGSNANTPQK